MSARRRDERKDRTPSQAATAKRPPLQKRNLLPKGRNCSWKGEEIKNIKAPSYGEWELRPQFRKLQAF